MPVVVQLSKMAVPRSSDFNVGTASSRIRPIRVLVNQAARFQPGATTLPRARQVGRTAAWENAGAGYPGLRRVHRSTTTGCDVVPVNQGRK